MTYAELIEYLSLSLTERYLEVIAPFSTDYLNASLSDRDYEGSCEHLIEICEDQSFVRYSGAEIEKIRDSKSLSGLERQLTVKLMSGTIEGTLHRFSDKELLTLMRLFFGKEHPTPSAITKEKKLKTRDIYCPCDVCGYKVHVIGDYNSYCSICGWDLELMSQEGRFKFNLDLNGNEMTIQEGQNYFKKYGIAKAGVVAEATIFERWLHDLANNNSSIATFPKYLDVWRINHSTQ